MGRSTQDALLQELVRRVVAAASPERIILFGSGARGDATPESDLDLLVVKADVPHRRRLAQEIYRHLVGVPVPVDVVVYTPDDLERFRACPWTIVPAALREGRELYAA